MGWHLQLFALLFFYLKCSPSISSRPKPIRNVPVDELLAYGVAIYPADLVNTSALLLGAAHGPLIPADPNSSPPLKASIPQSQRALETSSALPTQSATVADTYSSSDRLLPDDNFVFAAGTCMRRIRLTAASRSWRHSPAVRAFLLTDSLSAVPGLNTRGASTGETFGFFPSEGAPELGGWVRSLRAGDTRAAAAPFAAHRHFGETYKWMLYGDDDTVFFLDAVKELVAPLDPDLPWALSDNLWFTNRHPNPNSPRCLPCHMASEELPSLEQIFISTPGRVDIRATYELRRGGVILPISQDEYVAFARNSTQVAGERYLPLPSCPRCSREAACAPLLDSTSTGLCTAPVAHGGAGIIFSVGLMRSFAFRDVLACFLTFTNASGSDHMVSECLWRHGFAFTDPGALVRHKYDMQYVMFGGTARLPLLLGLESTPKMERAAVVASAVQGVPGGGPCDSQCRWMLRNVVSMHLHARLAKDLKALAALQEEVPRLRKAALRRVAARLTKSRGAPGPTDDMKTGTR